MKQGLQIILGIMAIAGCVWLGFWLNAKYIRFVMRDTLEEQTERLCRQYASGQPWGALPKERIEYLGLEYLENFDWYGSCLLNVKAR